MHTRSLKTDASWISLMSKLILAQVDPDGHLEYVRDLITCEECKYWGEDGYRNGCRYATCIMYEQDYCSMAERREE